MQIEKNGVDCTACRIPGLVCLENGVLIGCYERRKSSLSDWAQIDIKVIRSTDGGKHWQTVLLINGGTETLNNPTLVYDGKTIHLLYCQNYKRVFYRKSTDSGITFGNADDITSIFESYCKPWSVVAVGPGHGIVHNGRLIVPVWFANAPDKPRAHHPSFISTLYSDDGGISWKLGEDIGNNILTDPSESAAVSTADGKVMLSVRCENPEKRRALVFSADGAHEWSAPILSKSLPDPVCQGSMCRFGDKIYHINCASETDRINLTINMIAPDATILESILVDGLGGYSDIAAHGDKIYILYERDIKNDGLYFTCIDRYASHNVKHNFEVE